MNGYVLDDDPQLIAEKIDYLYSNREKAKRMGESGYKSMIDKNINWDYVIDKLLK